jgi:hypothetical protein
MSSTPMQDSGIREVSEGEAAKTPLQSFAQTVTEARKVFDAGRDMAAWLVFYEAKQTAYAKLVAALPKIDAIKDFWRYVQNMAPSAWLPIIESELKRITCSKYFCHDCGAVAVTYPQRRCAQCQKARRLKTYQKAKQRARVKQRMRKCQVCNVESNPRCRVCLSCQKVSRRARNQRYQKSLKDNSVRRVQPTFTGEEMSTVPRNHMTRQAQRTVDSEGVLLVGAVP